MSHHGAPPGRPQVEKLFHEVGSEQLLVRAAAASGFDAVIHLDQARVLESLERTAGWERGEVPETYAVGV